MNSRKFRFLVLDDDPDMRFLHRHAFEKNFPDCEVMEASDCDEALDQIGADGFDAVIADHQLQGESGADCIAAMRARGVICPILLVTGSSNPKVHERAYAAGATRVFPPGDGDFTGYLRSLFFRVE